MDQTVNQEYWLQTFKLVCNTVPESLIPCQREAFNNAVAWLIEYQALAPDTEREILDIAVFHALYGPDSQNDQRSGDVLASIISTFPTIQEFRAHLEAQVGD